MGLDDKFKRGQYKGHTVQEVFEFDEDYLTWCAENNIFSFDEEVLQMLSA